MANTASAKKRARQTIRRTTRNTTIRSQVKTAVRSAREAVEKVTGKELAAEISNAVSVIAKAAKRGVVHKRNAARKVSRLMKKAAKGATPTTGKRA